MIEKAKWVWTKQRPYTKDLHAFVRYTQNINKAVHHIDIEITASDYYKLYCNGTKIGEGPCPATPKYYYYDTFTIEAQQIKKTLCFAVHAYSIGDAKMVTCQNQGSAGVMFAAKIEYIDGTSEIILSSDKCKASIPAQYFHDYIQYDETRISKWGGFEEVYISSREDGDFTSVDYDDLSWDFASVQDLNKKFENILPREIPMLITDVVWPQAVLQTEPYLGRILDVQNAITDANTYAQIWADVPQSYPSIVFDFKQQVVGTPIFEVQASAGASMRILYGESLDMMRMDTLITSGKRQVYSPYQRRAFRFLKLTFNNSADEIRLWRVCIETMRYPYNEAGSFSCSDNLLNEIYQTSLVTVKQNAQNHFEDCVMREKMQWLADARVMSLVAYWNFSDAALSKKAIKQFFNIQYPDGFIPAAGPQAMASNNVDFCEHFVLMIYEYTFYTADTSLVQEYRESLDKLMLFFKNMEDENGLLNLNNKPEVEAFLDWANLDKRQKVAIINCMYTEVLRKYAQLMKLIGDDCSVEIFDKVTQIQTEIEKEFWNEDYQLLCDCTGDFGKSTQYSQQSNLCAVAYHGVRQEIIEKIIFSLTKKPIADNVETIKGAFFLGFALQGLFEQNCDINAIEQMRSFWGTMLERGATTWWETLNMQTPPACIPDLFSENSATSYISYIPCSHSHGWGASPAFLLPRYVLGIEPVEPGFQTIKFKVHAGNLQWAKGSIKTPLGVISVQWQRNAHGTISKQLHVPKGITVLEDN